MSIIVFEVLSKSLGSSSEGSKLSLSEVIGDWVLDISIEGLAFGRGTSFLLFYKTNDNLEQFFC